MATFLSALRRRFNSLSQEEPPNVDTIIDDPRPRLDISKLPVEILLCLLKSVDDIFTLRSLVYSCTSFLPVYNLHRQVILNGLFRRTVDLSLMYEARFARATGRIDFQGEDVASQVEHYIQRYHFLRQTCEPGVLTPIVVNYEQAQRMVTLYSAIYDLCNDFLKGLSDHLNLKDESVITFSSLRPPEQHRLKRAFFRYEIFCNLYRDRGVSLDHERAIYAPGLGKYNSHMIYRDDFDETMIDEATKARQFLFPFQPWEVEEFASVHEYCLRRWNGIIQDLRQAGDSFEDLSYDGHMCHLSMLGLEFLHQFLPPLDNSNRQARHSLISNNGHYEICNPKSVVDEYTYGAYPQSSTVAERQKRENLDLYTPTPGWKSFNNGLTGLVLNGRRDEIMRQLGVVFWDEDRLKGIERLLRSRLPAVSPD